MMNGFPLSAPLRKCGRGAGWAEKPILHRRISLSHTRKLKKKTSKQ